jgi:HK97 family phage portal protein
MLNWLRSWSIERKTLDINSAWALIDSFGGATASGMHGGPETALRNPVVYASTKILCETVGQLPLHAYRRDGDSKERATDHPKYELVNSAPNDWTDSFIFRCDMMLDLLKHGHAFAFVNRSRATGAVVELIQIPAPVVTIERDETTFEPTYFVTDGAGTRRQIDRQDLMHLRTVGGMSPIQQIKETIALSSVMELHAAKLSATARVPPDCCRSRAG